jgi:hypothetical protein
MRRNKQEIIDQILDLLTELVEDEPAEKQEEVQPMEMLTIKECTEAVKGLSEHTVRKLVTQGKIHYIRTGEGKCGKILINKKSLLDYLNGTA